ncbi:MAG: LemA family protein [Magnetococcales bacterium]|nr:LemA family protein [Magnetococcales bacterium]
MSTQTIVLIVLITVPVLLVLYVIVLYNGLVGLKNRIKNGYAQIDVQLKRRFDLIPNLVETAKAYMAHERDTLEAVIKARNQAVSAAGAAMQAPGDPQAMGALSAAEASLASGMKGFFALAENYPDLKANQNMSQLSEELVTTENKVAFARQAYNDAVMHYNTARESFPANLLVEKFGFQEAAQLESIEVPEERKAVKVSF